MAKEFHGPLAMALHGLTSPVFWLALAGVVLAYYMYMVNTALPAASEARPAGLHRCWTTSTTWTGSTRTCWPAARAARHRPVEGRRPGHHRRRVRQRQRPLVGWFAGVVRCLQSGYIYHYALAMLSACSC
jgi:NADH-quinone oxidoreductase subunit L